MATQTSVKTLVQGVQLPNAVASQYAAPANTVSVLKKVTVTNTTAGAVALTAYKVASAGTPGVANMVVNAQVIPASSVVEIYTLENHVLNAADSLQCFAGSATALTLHVSGIEIV